MQQHAAMTARPWRLQLYGINSWLFPSKKNDATFILVKLHVLSWFQSVSDFSYFKLFSILYLASFILNTETPLLTHIAD